MIRQRKISEKRGRFRTYTALTLRVQRSTPCFGDEWIIDSNHKHLSCVLQLAVASPRVSLPIRNVFRRHETDFKEMRLLPEKLNLKNNISTRKSAPMEKSCSRDINLRMVDVSRDVRITARRTFHLNTLANPLHHLFLYPSP